jgi:NAD+-dependent protein deacetylase SIR2
MEKEAALRTKVCSSAYLPVLSGLRSASSSPSRKASPVRRRLTQYHTFDHAVDLLKASSNILVLTGAGISTSVGIRDFRSENGLYRILVKTGIDDPQELFHIQTFKDDPDRFYDIIRLLLPAESTRFSPTHAFIKLLQDHGKLLTNYTQNIDGLEQEASIDQGRVVQCHGSLATAECMTCGHSYKAKHYLPVLLKPKSVRTKALQCHRCWGKDGQTPNWSKKRKKCTKSGVKRKRSDWEGDDDDYEDLPQNFGILKPSIIFFGENVANNFSPHFEKDKTKVDLLVIIGTSLQVEPVKNIPQEIPPGVPQIFINKERCRLEAGSPDIQLIGKCDVVVEELARRAGWSLKHDMIEADAGPVRVELVEGTANQSIVRRVQSSSLSSKDKSSTN